MSNSKLPTEIQHRLADLLQDSDISVSEFRKLKRRIYDSMVEAAIEEIELYQNQIELRG